MKQETFTKRMLLGFLEKLQDNAEYHISIYLKPASVNRYDIFPVLGLDHLDMELKEALSAEEILRGARRRETGLAIFWSESGNRLIILPPFPIQEDKVLKGRPDTLLLQDLIKKERIIGIMLINWGSYAVGIFNGEKLIVSKTGTGHIHKKIKKGGSSQKRFAMRTVEQKRHFLRRVANHIEEIFTVSKPEHIFFGGNRLIYTPLLKECPYLEAHILSISPRCINLRYADREALLDSHQNVNESLLFSF